MLFLLTTVALLWFPLRSIWLHHAAISLADDRTAAGFAALVARSAPPNAIVLTAGDQDTFALWYWHFVEGDRPDVAVVARGLVRFPWYRDHLRRLYPDLILPERAESSLAGQLATLNPSRLIFPTQVTP
ncbi:MAG: hypothetical protein HY332_23640 [Chloroflexi bacterium]|nr:hypothetical protein [Chloroflexota bacterium]